MRPNHLLEAPKATKLPTKLICYDTETSKRIVNGKKIHSLKLGCAVYYEQHGLRSYRDDLTFYDNKTFWDWVNKKCGNNNKITLIAHNQQFDSLISGMFEVLPEMYEPEPGEELTLQQYNDIEADKHLERSNWELVTAIIDSNLFIVKWYNKAKKSTLHCLDSFNWFKSSIDELGRILKLPKGLPLDDGTTIPVEFQDDGFGYVNGRKMTDAELARYCKRDVEITLQIMLRWLKFLDVNDLGNFASTGAGQAFNAFRHKFMTHDIWIHDNEKAIALERASYRGGRNECFRLGFLNKRIHYLDFNSLYPSVMLGNEYPTNLKRFNKHGTLKDIKIHLDDYLIVADLKIKLDRPLMAYKSSRLLFPVGTFSGSFTTPEIRRLLDDNAIIDVGRIAYYTGDKIFDEYVKFFYNERLKAKLADNDVDSTLFKYLLNELYGKFGQRTRENLIIGDAPDKSISVKRLVDIDNDVSWIQKQYGGKVFKCTSTQEESYNSFPAIASFCTSYARMKLLGAIETAGWENVYYCDTDSCFVNDEGKKRLASITDSKELGKMKIEKEFYALMLRGPKDYSYWTSDEKLGISILEHKIKGVPKRATHVERNGKAIENEYKTFNFAKINTAIRSGCMHEIEEKEVVKVLKRDYEKGIVLDNGEITPFVMRE